MPIYEYLCQKCGNKLEILQKLNEKSPECDKCNNGTMKQQMSRNNFHLKGTGWYKTDYNKEVTNKSD